MGWDGVRNEAGREVLCPRKGNRGPDFFDLRSGENGENVPFVYENENLNSGGRYFAGFPLVKSEVGAVTYMRFTTPLQYTRICQTHQCWRCNIWHVLNA